MFIMGLRSRTMNIVATRLDRNLQRELLTVLLSRTGRGHSRDNEVNKTILEQHGHEFAASFEREGKFPCAMGV